jgi:hypothetical protein
MGPGEGGFQAERMMIDIFLRSAAPSIRPIAQATCERNVKERE